MAISLPTSANNTLADLVVYANHASEGWLGNALLISIVLILFFSLKGFPTEKAFAASTFVGIIIAVFFRVLGILNGFSMWLMIIIGLLAFANLYFNER